MSVFPFVLWAPWGSPYKISLPNLSIDGMYSCACHPSSTTSWPAASNSIRVKRIASLSVSANCSPRLFIPSHTSQHFISRSFVLCFHPSVLARSNCVISCCRQLAEFNVFPAINWEELSPRYCIATVVNCTCNGSRQTPKLDYILIVITIYKAGGINSLADLLNVHSDPSCVFGFRGNLFKLGYQSPATRLLSLSHLGRRGIGCSGDQPFLAGAGRCLPMPFKFSKSRFPSHSCPSWTVHLYCKWRAETDTLGADFMLS